MEPNLVTDPKILNVLNELIQLWTIFHRPFLTPSIHSNVAHLSPVEQICHIHILKLQHHAATLTTFAQSIAHLLQQRWCCFASRKQRLKML
ncbi:hypothetical protein [Nostoc sp.]|uniref:hypothetical protein n=1 Tax=Nostoc sp. TaxID=1180 RepID=UPI002FF58294